MKQGTALGDGPLERIEHLVAVFDVVCADLVDKASGAEQTGSVEELMFVGIPNMYSCPKCGQTQHYAPVFGSQEGFSVDDPGQQCTACAIAEIKGGRAEVRDLGWLGGALDWAWGEVRTADSDRGVVLGLTTACASCDDPILTAAQLAKILGVHENWIYSQAKHGDLPSFKLGGVRRFCWSEVGEWLERHRNDAQGLDLVLAGAVD